jgi:hypothetical protein
VSGRRAELLLLAASVATGLLALEAAFRVAASLAQRRMLERAWSEPPPPGGLATLGQMLRPSRNRRLVYELKPGLDVRMVAPTFRDGPVAVRTSVDGFRDEPCPLAKAPGTYRVVGVGDSLMFGWGVPQGGDYLSLLEERLRRDRPEHGWDVVNMAVPGYNTAMEAAALEARGLAFQPDLVLVGYCGNDLALPNFIVPDEPAWSLRTSYLLRFVWRRLRRSGAVDPERPTGMRHAPWSRASEGFESDPDRVPERYRDLVGWDAFTHALRAMRDRGRERGFEVAVVAFMEVRPNRALDVVAALGLPLIDVGVAQAEYLRAHGGSEAAASALVLRPDDQHPSGLSHRLAADAVYDWMRARGPVAGQGH